MNLSTVSSLKNQALEWQSNVNREIEQNIDLLKAMGESIYYTYNDKLIREDADGRRFEYRPLPDGTEEVISEVTD
jgi:hypothetical protein